MADFCLHCGVRVSSSDARYCYQCGKRLPGVDEQQAADDATKPWWKPVLDDFRDVGRGRVPDRIEVVLRITAASFVAYVLVFGKFTNVIPSSQMVIVGLLTPLLSLLFPTLLFSVGAIIFPPLMFLTITVLILGTLLLSCAAGVGSGLYVFAYALVALLVSGLRFKTSTGNNTALLMLQLALNTQGYVPLATELGVDFVKSLWKTEGSGIANANAAYVDGLVGWMWLCLLVTIGRILPPFRTMRKGIARGVLPSTLRHVVSFVDVGTKNVIAGSANTGDGDDDYDYDDAEPITSSDEDTGKGHGSVGSSKMLVVANNSESDRQMEALVAKLVQDVVTLAPDGNIAVNTAFEPRLLRFGPQECSYQVLDRLCHAVGGCALSVMAVREVLGDRRDRALQRRLAFAHRQAAATLAGCATALENNEDLCLLKASDGKDIGGNGDDSDENRVGADDSGADAPGRQRPLPVDPLFLTKHSEQVAAETYAWAKTMAPPPYRGIFFLDKHSCVALWSNITPWMSASLSLWVEMGRDIILVFRATTWERIAKPPYYDFDKFAWAIKFAVGFTCLVSMGIYWDAFRELEIPVMDDGMLPAGANFAGWYLIAYAISTTQTVEGTVKKGLLRACGTAAGGFFGWLAITACGTNPYGLVAWATVVTFLVSYCGLCSGGKARFGADPNLGFGPGYFLLTQALVMVDVFNGAGGKNDITVNRIVANIVGMAMAIVMAVIPPGLYGGNPKFTRAALNQTKQDLLKGLRLVLEHADTKDDEQLAQKLGKDIEVVGTNGRAEFAKLVSEANDFYSDSSRFKAFPLFKVDPELKACLDSLRVLASWVAVVLRYASYSLKHAELQKSFMKGSESHTMLCAFIRQLDSGPSTEQSIEASQPTDRDLEVACKSNKTAYGSYESAVFVHYVQIACRKIQESEDTLSGIKWGAFS